MNTLLLLQCPKNDDTYLYYYLFGLFMSRHNQYYATIHLQVLVMLGDQGRMLLVPTGV